MESNEVIMFVLDLIIGLFLIIHWSNIKEIPHYSILISAFSLFLISCVATILEGLFLGFILNIIEHMGYLFSTLLVLFWLIKLMIASKKDQS